MTITPRGALSMDAVNIAVILPCINRGGIVQTVRGVAGELGRRGHHVNFVSLTPADPSLDAEQFMGRPVRALNYRGVLGWRSIGALRRTLRQLQPDVIWQAQPAFVSAVAGLGIGACVRLLSIHFGHGERRRLLWQSYYHSFGRQFHAVLCDSDYMKEVELRAVASRLTARAHVLGFCIATEQFPRATTPPHRKGSGDGPFVIGSAGWLWKGKRFDVLLEAIGILHRQGRNVQLHIAGDGPDRAALEQQAEGLGMRDRIAFEGWRDDMHAFYRAIDVLAFCSDFETAGRVPAEAMAAGRPVVCSVLAGGAAEVVRDGETGFFFSEHNPGMLAEAIGRLLTDAELYDRMSRAGRQLIETSHSVTRAADVIEHVIRDHQPRS